MKFGYGETSPRLYLLIAGLIWVQVISGCSERQQAEDVSPTPPAHQAESYDSIQEGMELATADSESAAVDTDIDEEARERLRTLGYTATARVTEGTGEKLGTVLHQPEEAYRGYNLFTPGRRTWASPRPRWNDYCLSCVAGSTQKCSRRESFSLS